MLGNEIEIGGRQKSDEIGKRAAAHNGDGTAQKNLEAHEERRQIHGVR